MGCFGSSPFTSVTNSSSVMISGCLKPGGSLQWNPPVNVASCWKVTPCSLGFSPYLDGMYASTGAQALRPSSTRMARIAVAKTFVTDASSKIEFRSGVLEDVVAMWPPAKKHSACPSLTLTTTQPTDDVVGR